MKKYICLSVLASVALAASMPGVSRADNFKVYTPEVEKGEFAAEANMNYSADRDADKDGVSGEVVGFEYGVNDHWRTELSAEFEKESGESNKAVMLKFENILVPYSKGEKPVDVGLYLEFEKALRDGEPNNAEVKFLLGKQLGRTENTANIIFEHEVGPHSSSDVGTGFALQSKYRLEKRFEPGFEYYADMGPIDNLPSFKEQDHKFGPIAEGKLGKIRYNTGALFGVSKEAPDTTIKLNLEYEF